jgi:hypothetical protein
VVTDGLWVNGLQRFDKQPEYTEVNPGQDALMTCKVFNKRGSCSWQKDNKVRLEIQYNIKCNSAIDFDIIIRQ